MACVVEAQQQFVGVVDVRCLFLEVFFQLVDGFALEGFVERPGEDASHVAAVDLFVDVVGWVRGGVRGSLTRAALEGGVR